MDLIIAKIDNNIFKFADHFPDSPNKIFYSIIEGNESTVSPKEVRFGDFYTEWLKINKPRMGFSKKRDYKFIMGNHVLPFFEKHTFNCIDYNSIMQFISTLKEKKSKKGKVLSDKRIKNILIPLRAVVKAAYLTYKWPNVVNVFENITIKEKNQWLIHLQ